jgi:acyl-homoserine-lactone acylase
VWGSLASFGARAYPGTKKWYGTSGNSFVAVVEFGPRRARAGLYPPVERAATRASKTLQRSARRYATGDLREVYFYRDQLKGHTEKEYPP